MVNILEKHVSGKQVGIKICFVYPQIAYTCKHLYILRCGLLISDYTDYVSLVSLNTWNVTYVHVINIINVHGMILYAVIHECVLKFL